MMKQLTEQHLIVDNWNKLIQNIEDTFDGETKETLEMYKYFENIIYNISAIIGSKL